MLPLHFHCLRRYGGGVRWPVFLATEVPDHPIVQRCVAEYGVTVLPIAAADAGFLDSRRAAVAALPPEIRYVFPMQEDFLLERFVDGAALGEAVDFLETGAVQVRLTPCPGPADADPVVKGHWRQMNITKNIYAYCFQATLWNRDAFQRWFDSVCRLRDEMAPAAATEAERSKWEVGVNLAENADGQRLFRKIFEEARHIGWERIYKNPNGVYFCPWPYRPTAIVRGILQPWAKELGVREAVPLRD
jgi:hypothetical protein